MLAYMRGKTRARTRIDRSGEEPQGRLKMVGADEIKVVTSTFAGTKLEVPLWDGQAFEITLTEDEVHRLVRILSANTRAAEKARGDKPPTARGVPMKTWSTRVESQALGEIHAAERAQREVEHAAASA